MLLLPQIPPVALLWKPYLMPAEITVSTVRERNAARNARSVATNARTENGSAAMTATVTVKSTKTAMMINTATTVNRKTVNDVVFRT